MDRLFVAKDPQNANSNVYPYLYLARDGQPQLKCLEAVNSVKEHGQFGVLRRLFPKQKLE